MAINTKSILTVYPMDSMVESIDDDGLPIYDRGYNADDLRTVQQIYLTDGIIPSWGNEFAVVRDNGNWCVQTGAAMINGLLVPHGAQNEANSQFSVIAQSDIAQGSYAYVIVAGRFDSDKRDGAIYAIVSNQSNYTPVRNDSLYELVLARIDWLGTMVDWRLNEKVCGVCAPFAEIDTGAFVQQISDTIKKFDIQIGTVKKLDSRDEPYVKAHKSSDNTLIILDIGIPQGKDGKDGAETPTTHIRPEADPPSPTYGAVWFVDDKSDKTDNSGNTVHTITDIRCYEHETLFPSLATYPSTSTYPSGEGGWVSHKLDLADIGV